MEENSDPEEFTRRTGLPNTACKLELAALGARAFVSENSFPYHGRVCRTEQMQLARPEGAYMWKRIVPIDGTGNSDPFQIHAEFSAAGAMHYNYLNTESVRAAS